MVLKGKRDIEPEHLAPRRTMEEGFRTKQLIKEQVQ
jgi:hypothetical protein